MKKQNKFLRFLRYEGKLLLITLLLIVIAGCISWRTFFRTPTQSEIRRDYLIEDISNHSIIRPDHLAKLSEIELEIVSRLDLNGLIALERTPEATRRVYQELKDFEVFYHVIDDFGPNHVIPVLDYFYEEGNLALWIEQKLAVFFNSFFGESAIEDTLSERQKRLLAILGEIQEQKHNFLSRFEYTSEGARRNQVATTTSSIINFFTGGLSRLNAAIVTRGVTQVTTTELVDAGIDILVLVPFAAYLGRGSKMAVRALRGSRTVAVAEKSIAAEGAATAARAGRLARISRGAKAFWRAIPIRTLFRLRYVKWYILGLAIIKPDLINHAATLFAKAVSVPPIVMKTGFWFLIFFPLLNLITPLVLLLRSFWRKYRIRRRSVSTTAPA